jgi:hypothetical protein
VRKLRVYGAGSFYLNSACLKVLVPVKIFQFQDMLNENRFLGTFRGYSKRPIALTTACQAALLTMMQATHVVLPAFNA